MPSLRIPKHQLIERVEYTFVRFGDRYGITTGTPDFEAARGVNRGRIVPDDSGRLVREGNNLFWEGHSQYYHLLCGVPVPGERDLTVNIARERFPGFNHAERRR